MSDKAWLLGYKNGIFSLTCNIEDERLTLCPCGSKSKYADCCGIYINGIKTAPTPVVLMRSRYSAYNLANTDYIRKTMRGKPLIGFNQEEARAWAQNIHWIDLSIIGTSSNIPNIGYVEFVARFMEGDKLKCLHETSEFFAGNGIWYYVDGVQHPAKNTSVPRNTACPCGSKKKFKNCHGVGKPTRRG